MQNVLVAFLYDAFKAQRVQDHESSSRVLMRIADVNLSVFDYDTEQSGSIVQG